MTVVPRALCEGISILQNRLSREGVEYEVANGAHIPNSGERQCEMMTIGASVNLFCMACVNFMTLAMRMTRIRCVNPFLIPF